MAYNLLSLNSNNLCNLTNPNFSQYFVVDKTKQATLISLNHINNVKYIIFQLLIKVNKIFFIWKGLK